MKKLLIILVCFYFSPAFADSHLPQCEISGNIIFTKTACYGTHTFTSGDKGDKYVGEFKDGNYNGQGTLLVQGHKYVGEFRDDKMHGQGTFTFPNGDKYVGEFKDNKRHGQGTSTFVNGKKYVGEFKYGKMNGQGTYTFASGDKYVGEVKDNLLHGFGTYIYINGGKRIGEWYEDEFVKSNFGYKDFMFGMPKKYVIDLDVCDGVDENAICYDKHNWRFNFSYTPKNHLKAIVIDLGVYEEDSWNDIKDKIEKKYDIDFKLCKKLFFSCTPKQLELFLNRKTNYFAYSFRKGQVLLQLVRTKDNIERMQVGYYNDELAQQNLENYKLEEEVSSDDF